MPPRKNPITNLKKETVKKTYHNWELVKLLNYTYKANIENPHKILTSTQDG